MIYRVNGVRSLALAAGALLFTAGVARAQDAATLLIVSQPASGVEQSRFVDLAPHLLSPLQDSGRYKVIVFQTTNSLVQNAVKAGNLQPLDIQPPISVEASHKIAKALNASLVLHVSAENTKDGVGMTALLESLAGQNTWNQVYVDKAPPAKAGKKRPSLLESIHVHVDRITTQLTGSHLAPLQLPGGVRFDKDGKPIPGKGTTETQPKTTPDNKNGTGTANAANAANAGPPADPSTNAAKPPVDVPGGGEKTAAPPKPEVSTYALVIDRARRNGDMAGLIVALRKAINERPRDVRLRLDLAAAYKERGWGDLAKEEALRAASLAPESGAAHRVMGDVLRDSGDLAGALKEYNEAVRLSPRDPACLMALGDAQMADSKTDDALKSFQAAAQADPKSPLPHLRIARLNVRLGSYPGAVAALVTAQPLAESDKGVLLSDCSAILTVVESTLSETLSRMQTARTAFSNGTKTREEAFKEVTALRKRADEISTFLDGMPEVGLKHPQALYGQAASLAVQAADKLLEHLESQSTSAAEEANLLRVEANKQVGEAAKRLKAITDGKSS